MKPPPKRAAWQWAKDERILPSSAAEPGPFNPHRTPWVIGITEAIANPVYSSVVIIMGSQSSKTHGCILNSIGWQLHDDPQPIIYIGPTRKNVESISSDHFSPMIKEIPYLFKGLARGKKDKITEKYINGVRLGFGWAGSATELASHPASKVYIDERDRMGKDVEGEGDVNTLADARTATFDGCVITASTPLVGDVQSYIHPDTGMEHWGHADIENLGSPTWALWQEGSRHEWMWPCPSCSEYHAPRFKYLWWPEGCSAKSVINKARMTCPKCGEQYANRQKERMNALGVFCAPGQKILPIKESDTTSTVVNDDGEKSIVKFGHYLPLSDEGQDVSFWVSGLCSPWRSFGRRAATFLKAVRSGEHGRIQAAINTGFGELYQVAGDSIGWDTVLDCQLQYKMGEVPEIATTLTIGVDVQKNRLVYVVRAWGESFTSWLIERGELWGETDQPEVWRSLREFLLKKYGGLGVSRMVVDSGYRPNSVYTFCRENRALAIPSKGKDSLDKPFKVSNIDVNVSGKVMKNGIQLWLFDTDLFKTFIHERLEWPKDQPGAWYVYDGIDEDYCRQITSEARMVKPSGQVVWKRIRRENHYFDAEVLAYLAMKTLGAPYRKRPEQVIRQKKKNYAGLKASDL